MPKVVPAVWPSVRRPTQEILGTAAVAGGNAKVGDAFSARYDCNCAIVALNVEAADDELEAAEELAELEELDELAELEALDCGAAALSLLDAVVPEGPLEFALVPPQAATRAEPADKPASRRKSRR
ncbi:MAG TPA: hypothetical protein VMU67_00640 [Steroidobacteraceae bacterium]|nr:hypothetical protein [Steroidobacteraceae bacterium]